MNKELNFRSLERAEGMSRADLISAIDTFERAQEIALERAFNLFGCYSSKEDVICELCDDIMRYLQRIVDEKAGRKPRKKPTFRSLKKAKNLGRRDLIRMIEVFEIVQRRALKYASFFPSRFPPKERLVCEICDDINSYLQGIVDEKERG